MNGVENLVPTSHEFGWGFDAVEELHQGEQGMVAIGGFGFHLMCVFDFEIAEVLGLGVEGHTTLKLRSAHCLLHS